ncbi:MAG: biotin--[acetyl-CoA-carboxylase] ligase [Bacteroidia bacterium]|nr:biotin--[acetyl-CoA-carboxylase] ligase [Bacteroidia bacterium]
METLFIGKNAVFLPETNSTNSYAIDLLKKVNLPEGTLVYTAHQTNGKGQRGAVWKSEPASNLALSLVLKPGFLELRNQYLLYQVAALACYDTIAALFNNSQFDIKIKWPNDILVNKLKVAGVLIENNLQNNRVNWCIVGVGINVNQEDFEDLPKASSIKQLTGILQNLDVALHLFCEQFERYYLALMAEKFDWIKTAYLQRFFGLNQWMNFEINGNIKQLLVKGLGQSGLLLLQDDKGKEIEVDVKEATWMY